MNWLLHLTGSLSFAFTRCLAFLLNFRDRTKDSLACILKVRVPSLYYKQLGIVYFIINKDLWILALVKHFLYWSYENPVKTVAGRLVLSHECGICEFLYIYVRLCHEGNRNEKHMPYFKGTYSIALVK